MEFDEKRQPTMDTFINRLGIDFEKITILFKLETRIKVL